MIFWKKQLKIMNFLQFSYLFWKLVNFFRSAAASSPCMTACQTFSTSIPWIPLSQRARASSQKSFPSKQSKFSKSIILHYNISLNITCFSKKQIQANTRIWYWILSLTSPEICFGGNRCAKPWPADWKGYGELQRDRQPHKSLYKI